MIDIYNISTYTIHTIKLFEFFLFWCNFSSDVTAQEQEELMIRKLRQCSVPFDFMDPMAELKGKEIKRDTLNELVDYVSTSRGVLTENMYPEIIKMV